MQQPAGSNAFETSPSLSPRSRSDSSSACVVRGERRAGSHAACSASRKRSSSSSSTSMPKSREELPDEPRVLDLLDRARRPEQRLVGLAEPLGELGRLAVAPERLEPRRGARPRAARRRSTRTASACRPSRREPPRARGARLAAVARKLLWASLALAPVTIVVRYVVRRRRHDALRRSRPRALVPLAWLIGEATEHAAEHTGPGIGGFLNASFGNAPELIIALLRRQRGAARRRARLARRQRRLEHPARARRRADLRRPGRTATARPALAARSSSALVLVAVAALPRAVGPGWAGDPERHSLAVLTIPVAVVLLVALRRRHDAVAAAAQATARRERRRGGRGRLVAAGRRSSCSAAATVVTALISEMLVHSLDASPRRRACRSSSSRR